MLYILIIVVAVILFFRINSLNRRVSILEGRSVSPSPVPPAASAPTVNINNAPPSQPQSQSQSAIATGPSVGDKFIEWLREDWLLKLGGLLLLIGFGWFATYAFMNDWIGPAGRITLGILAGVIILGLGTWRIGKYVNQGGVFLVIGSATILLTVFAAQEFYSMFTPTVALIFIFLSTAYIALVSVKYSSFAVSFSGLVLSGLAPLLVNNPKGNEIYLFSYLMVVVLGAIWIVAVRKNWGTLIFGSVLMVFFYSLPILFNSYAYKNGATLLNFAYVFAFVFFVSSIVNILKSKESDLRAFLWVAVVNGLFLLAWIMTFAAEEWQSLIIALWMVIFAAGSFVLFTETKIRTVFYVYATVAVAMLATATAIELDGAALTLAYTIESALIPFLIYLITKDLRASSASSFLLVGPIILSLDRLDKYYRSRDVLSEDFFVLLFLAIALLGLGLMYKKIKRSTVVTNFNIDNVWLIVGSVYVYTLLWTALHIAMRADYAIATTISLIIFTIVGLVKYFYGISIGSKILRNYGGIFLGLVVLRLIFIDVWSMAMSEKIVVFFLVGILLVSTAFISRKIKSPVVQ